MAEGPSTVIGPYKLLEVISEGGMGTVFLAEQVEPVRRYQNYENVYDPYPDLDTRRYAWIGNFQSQDYITNSISREVMEAMSDPNINGIQISGGGEICDNEARSYAETINGYEYASIWSRADNAYAVYDGNSQLVTFNNGNLTVNGDQLGANYNDTITVDLNSEGGVLVTLNGQSFSFTTDPTIAQVSHVTVNTGGGTNTVYVYNTSASAPVTIHGGGSDSVIIGNASGVQGISGSVTVDNPPSFTNLTIDDSGDHYSSHTVNVSSSSVTGLAPAPIYFTQNGLSSVVVETGSTTDTVNVNSTPYNLGRNPYTEVWDAGNGTNYINVYGTTGPLYLYGADGSQGVDVGLGSTAGINGFGDVYNSSAGSSTLAVDDSGEPVIRTVDMYNGYMTGIAPATIYWGPNSSGTYLGGVNGLTVHGSNGPSVYNVHDTSNFWSSTSLQTGTGNDTVYVLGTTGYLYDYNSGGEDYTTIGSSGLNSGNGSLGLTSGINGGVDVYGAGSTRLYVDDSADTTGHTVDMYSGYMTGIAPATISWSQTSMSTGGATYLAMYCSNGGSTYNIHDTSRFYYTTYLGTGAGNDTVNVLGTSGYRDDYNSLDDYNSGGQDTTTIGSSGLTSGINGNIRVYGPGSTRLYVDDSADTTGHTVDMGIGGIDGIAPAKIRWNLPAVDSYGVTYPVVYGSNGASTYNVLATPSFSHDFTYLRTGTGNDVVNVGNASGGLDDIQGPLTVNSQGGTDALTFNDNVQTTGHSYALTATSLTRAGSATVTFGTVGSLALNAGSGNDLLAVSAIPAIPVAYNGGGGTDTLAGRNTNETWNITGANAGTLGNITFAAVESLIGGTRNDTFVFGAAGSLSGGVNGGSGANDKIDFSAIAADIVVNLLAGTASGRIGGGIANIDTVVGGTGNNTLVGTNTTNMWTVTGANTGKFNAIAYQKFGNLTGGTGNDTFNIAAAGSLTGVITGGGGTTDKIGYTAWASNVTVSLLAGTAPDIAGFGGIDSFAGGTGSNTLIGTNADTTWTITATNAGKAGTVGFTGFKNLTGGTGRDVFKPSNGKGVTGTIDGGGGSNWLDDSLYTIAVIINLAAGTATNFGSLANINNARAGSGGSTMTGDAAGGILVGGTGVDTIQGGAGRSILIGGMGADTVKGGPGDDIVIGGYTTYDANYVALEAILTEWQSLVDNYSTRITKIKAGVSGGYKLALNTTVKDESPAVADTLTGGAGLDWFFQFAGDTITDLNNGGAETVN